MASTVNGQGQGTGQSSLRVSTTQGASKKSDGNTSLDKLGGGGGALPLSTDSVGLVDPSDLVETKKLSESLKTMQGETGAMALETDAVASVQQ